MSGALSVSCRLQTAERRQEIVWQWQLHNYTSYYSSSMTAGIHFWVWHLLIVYSETMLFCQRMRFIREPMNLSFLKVCVLEVEKRKELKRAKLW